MLVFTCLKAALTINNKNSNNNNNNNCSYFWSMLIWCHHSVVLLSIESFSHHPHPSGKTSDYFLFWSLTSFSGCKPHTCVSVSGLAECLQQGRRIDESEFEVGGGPRRARVNRVSLVSDADTSVNSWQPRASAESCNNATTHCPYSLNGTSCQRETSPSSCPPGVSPRILLLLLYGSRIIQKASLLPRGRWCSRRKVSPPKRSIFFFFFAQQRDLDLEVEI